MIQKNQLLLNSASVEGFFASVIDSFTMWILVLNFIKVIQHHLIQFTFITYISKIALVIS